MADLDLKGLAEAGGVCDVCGGVHIPNVDVGLLLRAAGLPACDCPNCEICEPFRQKIRSRMEAVRAHQTDSR